MTDTILSKLGRAMYATAPWVRPEGSIMREVAWDELPEQTRAMYEGFSRAAIDAGEPLAPPDLPGLLQLDDAYRLAGYELDRFRALASPTQDTVDVVGRVRAARALLATAITLAKGGENA